MFTKVLVANRGEIAVRIIRACHELGIETVAVYSEVDRAAMHVRQAGEAYLLGPAPSRDSYLRGDKLLEIAKKAGAGAIHPGYGFLAERDDFAEAVEKGMREVGNLEEMPSLLQSARREAEAAFGDGNVYLEKLLLGARHIEFQVIADSHGNIIHLADRECSIQRRHQKLLEEAPSPFMDEELRMEMGELACRAAEAVDYLNAGTIEFLVDKDRNFFFLEMNTRLQVEHPITEMVTGVDIVREQIRVARGRKLRYAQEDIALNGWAIECRINAEDPYNNFLPSTGQLTSVIPPSGPGVRVDTGVYAGFTITPHYDSLISKLICWGETRGEANSANAACAK
jgi:acetyl/propionyl-CoA carboxylase alpha subunit